MRHANRGGGGANFAIIADGAVYFAPAARSIALEGVIFCSAAAPDWRAKNENCYLVLSHLDNSFLYWFVNFTWEGHLPCWPLLISRPNLLQSIYFGAWRGPKGSSYIYRLKRCISFGELLGRLYQQKSSGPCCFVYTQKCRPTKVKSHLL